jgi:hypothetical protein
MQMRDRPNVFFAGQITRVEGYVESVAMGWLAGVNAGLLARDQLLIEAPPRSAIGSLARYVSQAESKNFQPVNVTFALLPPLNEPEQRRARKKRERRQLQVELALREWDDWLQQTVIGRRGRTKSGDIMKRVWLFVMCSLVLCLAVHAFSQSGRRQEPVKPQSQLPPGLLLIRIDQEAQSKQRQRPQPQIQARSMRTMSCGLLLISFPYQSP